MEATTIFEDLKDFIHGVKPPPWSGRYKIPWDEPGFSRRMLEVHLSQANDAASRRFGEIDRQVARLADDFDTRQVRKVLDLGCGPGLYLNRLARRGFEGVGIDFSPAAIDYARGEAERYELSCRYELADIRDGGYGQGYDAALLLYGEANAFPPHELKSVLRHIREALEPGAPLILEVHTFSYLECLGNVPNGWSRERSGIFSDAPYLCLSEAEWLREEQVVLESHAVFSADETAPLERYTNTLQAYTPEQYQALLLEADFETITFLSALDGSDVTQTGLFELRAVKG